VTRPWELWWEERANPKSFLRQPGQIDHPIRAKIVEEASGILGSESILDVGCATCIDYPLAKEAGLRYTGVDINGKFIEHAKALHPGIDAIQGDAFNLPFQDRSYDIDYCKDLLEHLPPGGYEKALREMWRVARKLMLIAFFIPPIEGPTKHGITSGGFYRNQYNRDEIVGFLKGLKGFGELRVIEDLGDNRSSLYIIEKLGIGE
jgi:SAM-dependent methyltransferase